MEPLGKRVAHAAVRPAPDAIARESLEQHVYMLAGEIGERNVKRPGGLLDAAHYISRQWQAMGYRVEVQGYRAAGVACANLEAVLEGSDPGRGAIVVAAHYDTIAGSPGADDNASGVAVLLELARALRHTAPAASLRFVALVNEEPPFYGTEQMGSWVYAHRLHRRGEAVELALNLDTLGYYTDDEGSQLYPPLFGLGGPERGDFVAFVTNLRSRWRARRMGRLFAAGPHLPCQRITVPGIIPGIDWNARAPFALHGFHTVTVTDTGPYRYPFYHSAKDRPEKLDYRRMTILARGLAKVVVELAA